MSIWLILIAIAMLTLSGVPAALGPRDSAGRQRLATIILAAGGALGLLGICLAMRDVNPATPNTSWALPLGRLVVSIDGISAIFLAPVFIIPVLGSAFGLAYWKQSDHPDNGRKLSLFYGLLAGSMAMVVIARDSVLFLISWEIMAVSAFFLATTEEDDPDVRRAGWVYLIATHVGTLCLLAMFALVRHSTGSFDLDRSSFAGIPPAAAKGIYILALIGFGFKAGLMPFHVWLPGAHSNAPSHVSAVLSGVMLKMGIYGIVRMTALLPSPPAWWGGLLLALGATTGILGMAFAIGQRDIKRLLAYSSIENIGIISMGLGLALLGRSLGRADWIVLGLGGSLLHVWNHSLFKPLLFMNAGVIIHTVHTREINQLGGLAKPMRATAGLFLLGALAICGLPPLNGFASEWLIYMGLFRTVGSAAEVSYPAASLGVPALALIGSLAIACFVNLFSAVFLGEPRNHKTLQAQDPSLGFTLPMMVLGVGCLLLGLLPQSAAPILNRAIAAWIGEGATPPPSVQFIAPFGWMSAMAILLATSAGMLFFIFWQSLLRCPARRVGTWDCGYALPAPRMQYTSSSFGEMLVSLFDWALWAKRSSTKIVGLFPRPASFERIVPDTVLDRLVLPAFQFAERCLLWFHRLQQGRVEVYLSCILVIVLMLLFWGAAGY